MIVLAFFGGVLVLLLNEAGVVLVGLNFFVGDLAGPGCGVLSISSRSGSPAWTRSRRHSASHHGPNDRAKAAAPRSFRGGSATWRSPAI